LILTQQFGFAASSEAAESQVLGPPALLPAESPAAYWHLYSLLQAELAPVGGIEKMWLRDLVDLQWEVRRWRQLSNEFLSSSNFGLDKILGSLPYDGSTTELKRNWTRRDPIAMAKVTGLLDLAGLTEDAILAQTLAVKLDQIDRIDRMTFQAERRRDLAIQQIERRREDLAARARAAVKRAEEKIEDTEFKELAEPEAPKKVGESEVLRIEEERQAPVGAEESKASDRTEDAEEHLPSDVGDHGREEAKQPEAPPISANPEERPPSVEREHALEQAELAEAPNIAEDFGERLPSQESNGATDSDAG
jgi:hypothetical protein